jgi:hypothetical protein
MEKLYLVISSNIYKQLYQLFYSHYKKINVDNLSFLITTNLNLYRASKDFHIFFYSRLQYFLIIRK